MIRLWEILEVVLDWGSSRGRFYFVQSTALRAYYNQQRPLDYLSIPLAKLDSEEMLVRFWPGNSEVGVSYLSQNDKTL